METSNSFLLMAVYLYVVGALPVFLTYNEDGDDAFLPRWFISSAWPVVIPLLVIAHFMGIIEVFPSDSEDDE